MQPTINFFLDTRNNSNVFQNHLCYLSHIYFYYKEISAFLELYTVIQYLWYKHSTV